MAQKCHTVEQGVEVALDLHKNKIAIVGQTNVGKSILFNKFSKSYSTVANYPQTTICAVRKDSTFAGKPFEIIDTPGISSLNIMSEDEKVTRDILIKEHPELIMFCGDATRLKRSLVLLSQLQELEIPTLFCLNMSDEASRKGIVINAKELTEEVGSTVVETAAIHGIGLKALEKASLNVYSQNGRIQYPSAIKAGLEDIENHFPEENRPSKGLLLLFLTGDNEISTILESKYGRELIEKLKEIRRGIYRKTSAENIRRAVFNARESWADKVAEKVTRRAALTVPGISNKLAWASRHPILGWPILLGILWVTFFGVATIATEMATVMDDWVFIPLTDAMSAMITVPILNEFLVGNFGILTMGIMNAIVTVVPILIVFFIIINFLEDVGYLPNLSVLANRILSYAGLSGKSVLPLVLGFGCNTMATLTSRTLETKKERIIASSLIALGVPCAVQLGVMIAILSTAPFSALLIVIGSVIATQIACGLLMNKLVPTKRKSDFIMELPNFRVPDIRHIAVKTYQRVKWFLVEALPLFVLGAALMFALEKTGLLDVIKYIMRPVVSGFLSMPDKITEVFILVLSRRELGAVYFKDFVDAGGLDYYQIVVGLIVMTLFIPCISNTMVMIKELGMRWAISINVVIIAIAVLVGGLVNVIIRMF